MQEQQEASEAARHRAEQRQRAAAAELAALEPRLHFALRAAAALDDRLQDAQAAVDCQVLEKERAAAALREADADAAALHRLAGRLAGQRGEQEAAVAALQGRLRELGLPEACLARLVAQAEEAASVASAALEQPQSAEDSPGPAPPALGPRQPPSWFRRRAPAAPPPAAKGRGVVPPGKGGTL